MNPGPSEQKSTPNANLGIELIPCCHRIGPTCKLLHEYPASISLTTLSDSCFTMWLTSLKLYEYEILAFDRLVTGLSPTVSVWSPYQRKGVLQRVLQSVVVSIHTLTSREFGKLLLPSYLGATCTLLYTKDIAQFAVKCTKNV